jgi:light-regulated signal transduction histidine kinase (bacteriophytochrome)
MKMLITGLLAFAKIGKEKLCYEPVNLNKIAQEVLQDLESAIKEKNAIVSLGQLPQIEANPIHIHQIFLNLISNSIKYSKPGCRISVSAESGKDNIRLYFEDNGIGFDEQYKEKIFVLFQRLHGKEEFPGTGIGLTICKKIVELYKGSISASSKSGEGTVIKVVLPKWQH